jgi:uncharacterized HAD superfamily protein
VTKTLKGTLLKRANAPKLRIAVDLDGVLADTIVTVCRILNEKRRMPLSVESFNQWNAWEIAGISRDEFFNVLDEAWFSWKEVPPTEGNLAEKVDRIREFGLVDIVTGRSPGTVRPAKHWLEKAGIQYDSFVRSYNTTDGKAQLNYDVYVDDNAELMSMLAARPHATGILYLQPWNRNVATMPRIYIAQGWDEIPSILQKVDK